MQHYMVHIANVTLNILNIQGWLNIHKWSMSHKSWEVGLFYITNQHNLDVHNEWNQNQSFKCMIVGYNNIAIVILHKAYTTVTKNIYK